MPIKNNRFLRTIKDNKFYIISMTFFIFLFSLIVSQVILYADDFALYSKALHRDLSYVFLEIKDVYLHWGGGPTPGLAILVLFGGLNLWKVLNVIWTSSIVHMLTNMAIPLNKRTDKKRAVISAIIWSLIFLINLSVSRETLYWFDGSMAYVLTTYLTIMYLYFVYRYIVEGKKVRKRDYFLLPLLAFFAGWNGPQAGAIAVFVVILILIWQKFFKKEKVNKLVAISSIFVVIGFAILYFAPGNGGRMESFPEYSSYGFIGKIMFRVGDVSDLLVNLTRYPIFNIPTFLLISSIFLLGYIYCNNKKFDKKRKIIVSIATAIVGGYVLLQACYLLTMEGSEIHSALGILFNFSSWNGPADGIMSKFKLLCATFALIAFVISYVYLGFEIMLIEKNPIIFVVMSSVMASHFMMLMAPYSPYRSTFITIIFLILLIVLLIDRIKANESVVSGCLAFSLLFYNMNIALLFIILYVILFIVLKRKEYIIFCLCTILIISVCHAYVLLCGYYSNRGINDLNEQIISEYDEGVLELYRVNENYGFTPIYSEIEWIRTDMCDFYDLPRDIEIVVK